MPWPRSLRANAILGPSCLLLRDRDLAALGLAVLGGRLGLALALAPVLALAGVVRALARAVALALVDALTHHLRGRLLVRLALGEGRPRCEQGSDGGGEDGVLHRHGVPPESERCMRSVW